METELKAIKCEIFDSIDKYMPNSIFYQLVQSADGKIQFTYLSDKVKQYVNAPKDDILQNPDLAYSTILPDYLSQVLALQQESFEKMAIFETEFPISTPKGETRWVHLKSVPKKRSDGSVVWNGLQRDITQLKLEELKTRKINRELKLLNSINDIILQESNEDKILEKVFQCLLKDGDYKLVWLCKLPDKDNTNQVIKPIIARGDLDYLKEIRIDLMNLEESKGPTATVLLNGGYVVTNNLTDADYFTPWRDQAISHGIGASLALEFNYNNRRGALNIYSKDVKAFDKHEIEILQRICSNLQFCFQSLKEKQSLNNYVLNLAQRVKELKGIYSINDYLAEIDFIKPESFNEIVKLISASFQYPDFCETLIQIGENNYKTAGFHRSDDHLLVHFDTLQGPSVIEVMYTKPMPQCDHGPFLNEELNLLKAVAKLLTSKIKKLEIHTKMMHSEANLKTIFQSANISYAIFDPEFRIKIMNSVFLKNHQNITGHDLHIGDNFIETIKPDRKAFVQEAVRKLIHQELEFIEIPIRYKAQDTDRYLSATYYPIATSGKIDSILIVGIDTTKNKMLELERVRIINDLTQRNTDLQQFAHIISHNLRAPVANIIGLNRLLKEEKNIPANNRKNIIDRIGSACNHLDEVIQDLNNILQIRREILDNKETINLKDLIHLVTESINHMIQDCKAEVHLMIPDDLTLVSLRSYLVSILYNLISNSLKYSKPETPPRIEIQALKSEGNTTIVYRDNGLGIDMESYGQDVFGLYQRFHLHKEGKGIGLYMTKTQVEVLGGKINLKSKINEGVEFTIVIPDDTVRTINTEPIPVIDLRSSAVG